MKLAIFGDSFSARVTHDNIIGWPIELEQYASIDNFSHSGSSEYRIFEIIKSTNLEKYDKILISHTSPLRMFVRHNPIHQNSQYHKNCDIIFQDIEQRKDEFSVACQLFYKHIFDIDYSINMHNLICHEIEQLTNKYNTLHITHFDYTNLYQFKNFINFYPHWLNNKGPVNHYSKIGNNFVANVICNHIL
jgi:hypothetical protein